MAKNDTVSRRDFMRTAAVAGCHISQQTGKRIPIQSTFKWPIFS